MKPLMKVGVIGNPNCGKSTLFNTLTGSKQRIGNWPGVTVERKSGFLKHNHCTIELIDLPGIYSLSMAESASAMDEKIACETLLSGELDAVINIVDATNLERNLYLTTQLAEMNIPIIIAVNMIDIAKRRGINIDIEELARNLKCPVIAISATKKIGIKQLKELITKELKQAPASLITYPTPLEDAIALIETEIVNTSLTQKNHARCLAIKWLEGDCFHINAACNKLQDLVIETKQQTEALLNEEIDLVVADARYTFSHTLCKRAVKKQSATSQTFTQWLDKIVLNRFIGIPLFIFIMYLMFLFSINIGGAFQDFFDISSDTIFVQGFAHLLTILHVPAWITAILAVGFGKGINTTITFIPVIGGLFLFLSFLEASGYMARAAFVMDRCMRALGLPGKSFVPMIVGFGCNVPAIMATRTLENRRDRILTVLMSPFMSCGARLAIYAVFTAAFFPRGGQNVVFALYLIGIVMAVVTGLILRKTVLKGEPSPLVMELPPYHVPALGAILRQTWYRLRRFLFKAGKLIIPICMLIGTLNAINTDGTLNMGEGSEHSVLSAIGRTATPLFAPMGIQENNWPATVGLVSGVLAKEVVVGTLNTLYSQIGQINATENIASFNLWQGLHQAVISIPENIAGIKESFSNPILASAPEHNVNQAVLGVMYEHFDGQLGAMAYLLFVLLYFPCVSATAAMLKELNRGWTCFSVCWTTGIAYAVAVVFYQAATFMRHPISSLCWIASLVALFIIVLILMKRYAMRSSRGIDYVVG